MLSIELDAIELILDGIIGGHLFLNALLVSVVPLLYGNHRHEKNRSGLLNSVMCALLALALYDIMLLIR
jgi:hypothetical protein